MAIFWLVGSGLFFLFSFAPVVEFIFYCKLLRTFFFKSHFLFPLYTSISVLAFCGSVEFFFFKFWFCSSIYLIAFLIVLSPLQSIFNLIIYLYLILHIYPVSPFFFLSFPLKIFVSFVFIAVFPMQHLALVLFSSLCFT